MSRGVPVTVERIRDDDVDDDRSSVVRAWSAGDIARVHACDGVLDDEGRRRWCGAGKERRRRRRGRREEDVDDDDDDEGDDDDDVGGRADGGSRVRDATVVVDVEAEGEWRGTLLGDTTFALALALMALHFLTNREYVRHRL